jgi:probable rRNA maturation factor
MAHQIDLQVACQKQLPISEETLRFWISLILKNHREVELTLRFVELDEITQLNCRYRSHDNPTNVLAFPSDIPTHVLLDYPFLGDVIVCPAILELESIKQNIPLTAHWAHIIIHGVLHLLGFDHLNDADTRLMQKEECNILLQLGISNPYHKEDRVIE